MIESFHCDLSVPYTAQSSSDGEGYSEFEVGSVAVRNVSEGDPRFIPLAFSSMDCYVTASSSGSSSIVDGGYNGLNRSESLFLFGVLIFFISMMAWKKFSLVRDYEKTK